MLLAPAPVTFHIGGPKTGSSAIQTWLARNQGPLEKVGRYYHHDDSLQEAAKARITSGNAGKFFNLNHTQALSSGSVWSSELLFYSKPFQGFLQSEASRECGPSVVILYFRDILEWMGSSYHQSIKRGGGVEPFEAFFAREAPNRLRQLLKWAQTLDNTPHVTKFFNYSRHKENLIQQFVIEGLRIKSFEPESLHSEILVSRSLHHNEASLLIELNRLTTNGELSQLISDHLVNNLPSISYTKPSLSGKITNETVTEIRRLSEGVNAYFSDYEKLELDIFETGQESSKVDSRPDEWFLELGRFIAKLNYQFLDKDDYEFLISVAGKIQLSHRVDPEDGEKIRRIAREQRGNTSESGHQK